MFLNSTRFQNTTIGGKLRGNPLYVVVLGVLNKDTHHYGGLDMVIEYDKKLASLTRQHHNTFVLAASHFKYDPQLHNLPRAG